MINLRNIAIVYRKELLDSLRDRRTIISTIVAPILMFPLIFLGFGALANWSIKRAQAQAADIVIIGEENSPELTSRLRALEGIRIKPASNDFTNRIAEKQLRLAVEIPVNSTNAIKIFHYSGEIRSQMALKSVQKTIREFRDEVVARQLAQKGVSTNILSPFEIKEENVVPPQKVAGNLLGGLVPYMIIFLSFVGCMAPALDLTAGEKERGTIEAILASPIGRGELVIGKFLLVLTTSILTTIMALLSNAITLLIPVLIARDISKGTPMPFDLSGIAVMGVLILVFPLAVTFAATQVVIGSYSGNYKEAQSYISPLMLIVMLPAMAALLPGFDLNAKLALVPVLNASLASREIMSGTFHWGLISIVFLSSCVYAMAALAAAIAAFRSESILFRT